MEREILFRGKTQYQEWIEGSYVQTDDNTNNPMRHHPLSLRHQIWSYCSGDWNLGGWEPIDVIPETVGQFTGLTDKNGKKIFEGDMYKRGKEVYLVTCTTLGGFLSRQIYDDWLKRNVFGEMKQSWLSVADCKRYEIVGNIIDNHELLRYDNNWVKL